MRPSALLHPRPPSRLPTMQTPTKPKRAPRCAPYIIGALLLALYHIVGLAIVAAVTLLMLAACAPR